MEIFAEAYRTLNAADDDTELNLVLEVFKGNKTIPVIVTDENNDIINNTFLNIDIKKGGRIMPPFIISYVNDRHSAAFHPATRKGCQKRSEHAFPSLLPK